MEEITYIWKIVEIKAYPTYEDKTDVVCTVVWQLVATNGEYGSQLQGSIDLPTENLTPFTPYDQLTEEQVLSWVKETMDPEQVLSYEQGALTELELLINPPVINLPLPWSPGPTPPTDAQIEEVETELPISDDSESIT